VVDEYLDDIESILNSCSCSTTANSRVDALTTQNREDRRDMLNRLDDVRSSYSRIVESQSAMIEVERRESAVVRSQNASLQQMLGLSRGQVEILERQLSSTEGQLQVRESQLERARDVLMQVAAENAANASRAQLLGERLNWTVGQLERSQNQLEVAGQMILNSERERVRNEVRAEIFGQQLERTQNQLERRENQLEATTELFNNMQITSAISESQLRSIIQLQELELREKQQEVERIRNEWDERITPEELHELTNTLQNREREIEEKEQEIAILRSQLGQSRGERLNQEINSQQQELENLAHRLVINWEQIQLLRDAYEQLVRARRNNDQVSMRISQDLVEDIRQNLLQARVHIDDVRRIGKLCEKIAETRLQSERDQEQAFEAYTQVPPRRY
jgi:chromosome segregation ATPase